VKVCGTFKNIAKATARYRQKSLSAEMLVAELSTLASVLSLASNISNTF